MIRDLKPYLAYKDSGVPWLGKVPEHWKVMPGRACYKEKKELNKGLKEKTVLSLSYGQIVVKPEEKLHGLVPESFETYQIVNPGDIIIRPTDLQNDWNSLRFGLSRHRGIITSAYMCFDIKEPMDRKYGHLLLHTYDLKKVFYGLGSGLRQNLDWRDFKYLPCLVPPLPEQTAIIRFLDFADRRIRRSIRAKRKLITLLNEQKQAIIHQAVTRGLDPSVRFKPSGVPWLGEVPEHWEILALKRVLNKLIDCEHKTAPAVDASDYRVVRTTAVRDGELRLTGTYCTTEEGFSDWTRRGVPKPGDVILTREAPAGEACVVPTGHKICLGQRTVLMKVRRSRYDPYFLVHMIYGGPPTHYIKLASQGSTVDHFNVEDIAALVILAPPLSEQVAIVDYIEKNALTVDLVAQQKQREIDLLQEYRARLIADVITGKLDVHIAAANLLDETGGLEPLDETDGLSEADEPIEDADLEAATGEAEA